MFVRTSLMLSAICFAAIGLSKDPQNRLDDQAGNEQASGRERLNRYFELQVAEVRESSAKSIEEVTLEQWPQVSEQWRGELREMLGLHPLPERTDLAAKVVGTHLVEGVKIEKLHYQSRPGLYVCANLYLPDQSAPKTGWPAVLYVCGHARVAEQGRLMGNKTGYHHHGLWFARHGVACLIIDTIQLGEFMGEHHGTFRFGRWDWVTRGFTPAGVETWNAIRGIDYLQSRKEINAERIGITGRSGGGAYSWFTAALDTRIKAAVPVAGITDLEDHILNGCVSGHCDCMYMVNYYRWDYPKLAALIAPRPLLLANSDHDTIFPLGGVMRTHAQLVNLYEKLKSPDTFRVLITPGPHLDTQELQVGAFHWLLDHLKGGPTVVDLPAAKSLEPSDLVVFQHEMPLQEHVNDVGAWFVPTGQIEQADSMAEMRKGLQNTLFKRLKLQWNQGEKQAPSIRSIEQGAHAGYSWERSAFSSQGAWQIEMISVEPKDSNDKHTVTVVMADASLWQNVNEWLNPASTVESKTKNSWQRWLEWSKEGRLVIFAPRGVGKNAWDDQPKELTHLLRRFYLLGQSVESGQLYDAIQVVDAVRAKYGDKIHVQVGGVGRSGMLAVLHAVFDPQIKNVVVDQPVVDLTLAPSIPGMAREVTWEALIKSVKPKELGDGTDEASANEGPERRRLATVANYLSPTMGPMQASGIKIVEVAQDAATVWTRTTRWHAQNLGDMAELTFAEPVKKGTHNRGPQLPVTGIDGLRYAIPGIPGEVRVRYRTGSEPWRETDWVATIVEADYSRLVELKGLKADKEYEVRVEARPLGESNVTSTTSGKFKTLAPLDRPTNIRLAVTTCQEFADRDGPFGFDLYRTMLRRSTDAMVHAGDVVYYDKQARSVPLAHYHWHRVYGLPSVVEFHRQVPAYFLKDDHDTYVDDSWPGQKFPWTEAFTFEDGQRIFVEQTGMPEKGYRTYAFGRDLQVWMMEGRNYRSPNNAEASADKTIWGKAQWDWLQQSMEASQAKFKVVISPTPIVGPDRDNKHDNHANDAFEIEGERVREYLAKSKRTFSVCGDRHWQYHSIDPKTGLHEFSVGAASDRHAGGWDPKDYRPEIHRYLRVGGGYLEIDVSNKGDRTSLTMRHLDTEGNIGHEVVYE